MEDFDYEEWHEMLNQEFSGGWGYNPNPITDTPPGDTSNDPIDKLNASLYLAGLGCCISDERHV